MKLIKEYINPGELELIKEETGEGNKKECIYRIKGPFLAAEVENKNGRIYPQGIIEREIQKFNDEKIKTGRSMGELDHPDNPQINLERVSHIVESLEMVKNEGVGCARLINTPMGRIAQTLVKEGVMLGMSTRGVGSLDGKSVQEDYSLIAIDTVADPSYQNAFVEGVLENREFIIGEDGEIIEVALNKFKKSMDEHYSDKELSSKALSQLLEFVGNIKSKNL